MADLALKDPHVSPVLVEGDPSLHKVTNDVAQIVRRHQSKIPKQWYMALAITGGLTLVLFAMLGYLVFTGIGVWGNNQPVGWAWDITNFVFWIGIGHAGTLISAILFLFRQKWRTSINRFAEAMTLFAVACAVDLSAVPHRPSVARRVLAAAAAEHASGGLAELPQSAGVGRVRGLDIRDRVRAVLVRRTDSRSRDHARSREAGLRQKIYGALSLGWRGSARHWRNYEMAYLILAGVSTPLVLSVHSVVSFDFATSVLPGWHTTIFPPYFVAGAIFSGFAMVVTLMVIARWAFQLEHLVTMKHLENMNKIMLATGTIVGYAYATEFFIAWYSGNPYERFVFINRAFGPYCVGLLDDDQLQRDLAAVLLVQEAAHQRPVHVRAVDFREHRNVVRAVRDHRDLSAPRLPAIELGLLPSDLRRYPDVPRHVRPVPDSVPVLRAVPADDRRQRSEGHDGERGDA